MEGISKVILRNSLMLIFFFFDENIYLRFRLLYFLDLRFGNVYGKNFEGISSKFIIFLIFILTKVTNVSFIHFF
jgi:hypothetical protein